MQTSFHHLLTPELRAILSKATISPDKRFAGDLTGGYSSAIRGSGLEFMELGEYSPSDEIRQIDWKASARSSRVLVKRFIEERHLNIVLALDISGSVNLDNRSIEIAATIGSLAELMGDSLGIALWSNKLEKYLPPDSKKLHYRKVAKLLAQQNQFDQDYNNIKTTDLNELLTQFSLLEQKRTKLFIISDFFVTPFKDSLIKISHKHEVTGIHLISPLLNSVEDCGLVTFKDAENGNLITLDTSSNQVRGELIKYLTIHSENTKKSLKEAKANYSPVKDNVADALKRFFKSRSIR
jgi:uncharacterized protein (DUF58 family)